MASYNDVFGNFTIPPAEATYSRLTLNDSGMLAWPANFSGEAAGQYLATNILEISAAAGLQLLLPPANEASVGQDLVVRNVGAESIDLFDADGGPITTLAAGESKYIYITNNSTAAGTWSMFTYGAGISGADAALLAGEGLRAAAGNTIQVAAVHRGLNSDYRIVEEDRGQLLNVEVGTITVTTPDATAVASGFYCFMRNSALGNASVVPFSGQSINGVGAWTLSPGDSLILMSTGTNWVTVGFGQNVNFTFAELVINAAAGDATLSSSNVSGRMIRITGTATASIVLTLPSVDNIYFVNVESGMGAHTVTLKTSGVGGVVVLNANEKTALYSDGVNVTIAITTTVTSTLSLTDGGPTAPSLFFALDTDTGLYRKTNDTIGFTAGGAERMALSPAGLTLQTALPVAQGGTGATTAVNALANLGATTNTRNIIAGDGLTGGGNLTADRTLTLGTPGTLTTGTTNSVSATSHTHAVTFPVTSVAGKTGAVTLAKGDVGLGNVQNVDQTNAANVATGVFSIDRMPMAVRNRTEGAIDQDPDLAVDPVILTNHANSPNSSYYWHITTTFYSTISATANRGQIAVQYNAGAQVWSRSSYEGTWTAWTRVDNVVASVAGKTGAVALAVGDVSGAAASARTITAGNGLTGGGNLTADRTLTLGTPSTLTTATTNAVTATSHTHAVTFPVASDTVSGIIELATTAEAAAKVDTTRAVTAAGVAAAILTAFPVGSIYITAGNTNPGTFLGGTWAAIGAGRTLMGAGTLGPDTYTAGATGGAAQVTLTANEMPSHNHGGATGTLSEYHNHSGTTGVSGGHTHDVLLYQNTGGSVPSGTAILEHQPAGGSDQLAHTLPGRALSAGDHSHSFTTGGYTSTHSHTISSQGGGAAHENRMPYLVVHFWQRTA